MPTVDLGEQCAHVYLLRSSFISRLPKMVCQNTAGTTNLEPRVALPDQLAR